MLCVLFMIYRLDRTLVKNDKASSQRNIPFDVDITIYPETRLKMNHEGCSNSLSEECSDFHRHYGKVIIIFSEVTNFEKNFIVGWSELHDKVKVSMFLHQEI